MVTFFLVENFFSQTYKINFKSGVFSIIMLLLAIFTLAS